MNALILANRLPFPLDDGWKVRTWQVVSAVASTRRVVLAAGGAGDPALVGDAERSWGGRVRVVPLEFGRPYAVPRLARGALSPMPVHYWNYQHGAAHVAVKDLVSQTRFTLGMAVLTFLAPYLEYLPAGAARIIDTHNIDSANMRRYVSTLPPGPRRWFADLTARKLAHLESRVFPTVDDVWVCSEEDRLLARGAAPSAHVSVIPNGVDLQRFAPGVADAVPGRLLFFGRLDYFPNDQAVRWFVEAILPLIRREVSGAHLEVVGVGATPSLRDFLEGAPGVRHLGPVADLPSAVSRASIIVVPLQAGGGTRLKILEALGVARPVVSTSVGAEGLALEPGREVLIANDPEGFAAAVTRLLQDPILAERMGLAGRRCVEARYDWAAIRQVAAERVDRLAPAGETP